MLTHMLEGGENSSMKHYSNLVQASTEFSATIYFRTEDGACENAGLVPAFERRWICYMCACGCELDIPFLASSNC